MTLEREGIPPTLTLLFDGMKDHEIAEMIVEQLGPVRAQDFVFALAAAAGCSIPVSMCPQDILTYIDESEEREKYVGTHEELKAACMATKWSDSIGESYCYERDDLMDELRTKKLVVPQEPEE